MQCTKVKFASQRFADEHIKRINKSSDKSYVPIRSYLCSFCGCWHLTSKQSKKDLLIQQLLAEVKALKKENNELRSGSAFQKQISADDRVKSLMESLIEKNRIIKMLKKDKDNLLKRLYG